MQYVHNSITIGAVIAHFVTATSEITGTNQGSNYTKQKCPNRPINSRESRNVAEKKTQEHNETKPTR